MRLSGALGGPAGAWLLFLCTLVCEISPATVVPLVVSLLSHGCGARGRLVWTVVSHESRLFLLCARHGRVLLGVV